MLETARCVDVEVLVVGGGLSGVAASVSSSRAGASTILVENHGYPGGTSTAGLMSSTTNFYLTRKGHLVARGFAYELLERLRQATDRTSLAKFATVPQIPHDLEALKDALIGLLYESGVRCLFHSTFISCHRHGDHWAVKLQTPSGPLTVNAAAVVDATGDASVIHAAGGDCVVAPGSASLEFRMADVNFERLVEYIVSDPSQYDEYCDVETTISDFRRNWESFGIFHLSHGNGKRTKIVQDAIRKGRYSRKVGIVTGMDAFGMYGLRQTRTAIINTGFVVGDFLDPFFLSEAEIQARRAARIASEFLINEMPRFEDSFLVQTAEEIGIRALRRIQGRYLLTRSEIQAACRFPDSIASEARERLVAPGLITDLIFRFEYLFRRGWKGCWSLVGRRPLPTHQGC